MDINKNIKKMRTEKKLTQEELAQKINVTRQAVSNWENAKTQPDLETLISIAEALQVDFEALLNVFLIFIFLFLIKILTNVG